MDTQTLVEPNVAGAQRLLSFLDSEGTKIRAALWVLNPDSGIWRLWLTPAAAQPDKREMYAHIARQVSEHRAELAGLDTSDIEIVPVDHPAVAALSKFIRVEGMNSVHFSKNMFNGYFLPDAILLRMT